MVATLLSLKFHLTIAELKRSTVRLVLWIIGGLYVLAMIVGILVILASTSSAVKGAEAQTGSLIVLVGSLIVIGWILLPLVFFGSDQTLDPARFTQFPLKGSQLAPGLAVAGIVGLPGFFTALIALGSALPWVQVPVAFAFGLVGGVLGWFMTQLGARAASATLSGMLSSRKAKDMTGMISLIVILMLSMVGSMVSIVIQAFSSSPDLWQQTLATVDRVSAVLSWTPLGAPWALATDAGRGQWLLLVGHLVVTLAYIVLGLWGFGAILDRALVAPAHAESTTVITKGDFVAKAANWFWANGSMTPVAAITARCLRYWRRDPRYLGQMPAILLMPILFTVMSRFMGSSITMDGGEGIPGWASVGMIAFGLGFMALMTGYTMSADVSSDSTAWWIHLASGVKGWQDRLGRVFGNMVWAAPLIIIVGVAVAIINGSTARIPAVLGAMLVLYLTALAVASVFSALIIYPMPLPGESPLRMKSAMMGAQMLSQMGSMGISAVLALPVCLWAVFTRGWTDWLILIVGIVWGVIVLVVGVILGGKVMDSRGPAILLTLRKNDSRERG
ncbi:MAG: hypothetical protein LBV00_01400 [Propionibacteriaceae bacterium]|nr:hypothetical protein [Propionibacteriaceae bacterium]